MPYFKVVSSLLVCWVRFVGHMSVWPVIITSMHQTQGSSKVVMWDGFSALNTTAPEYLTGFIFDAPIDPPPQLLVPDHHEDVPATHFSPSTGIQPPPLYLSMKYFYLILTCEPS